MQSPPSPRFDPNATAARYAKLAAYTGEAILDDTRFRCASETSCRRSLTSGVHFAAGQLSHVGRYYDAFIGDAPFRVLVIAMDTGRSNGGVSLDQRRSELYASAALSFTRRNPHMRGTTLALRAVFQRENWQDASEEFLDDDRRSVHLFDAYAMANLRLCSATLGSTQSKGTTTMSRNCLRHLRATIDILEPTLVIVQGAEVGKSLRALVRDPVVLGTSVEAVGLAAGAAPVVLATFPHPSYPAAKYNWSAATRPYFAQTVLPALRQARHHAIAKASGTTLH